MPYFLATAVFEVRAPSREEADREAKEVLDGLRHARVSYLEHTLAGSLGPSRSGEEQFFTLLGDFSVEAASEEKADALLEEVLDALSTDSVQYLTHGLAEAEPRVEKRQEREKAEEVSPEEEKKVVAPAPVEEVFPPEEPLRPPPRPSMRVTFTVTLESSELAFSSDTSLDEEALTQRAIEEARKRYPHIPPDLLPRSFLSSGTGGDKLITLVWEYEASFAS